VFLARTAQFTHWGNKQEVQTEEEGALTQKEADSFRFGTDPRLQSKGEQCNS